MRCFSSASLLVVSATCCHGFVSPGAVVAKQASSRGGVQPVTMSAEVRQTAVVQQVQHYCCNVRRMYCIELPMCTSHGLCALSAAWSKSNKFSHLVSLLDRFIHVISDLMQTIDRLARMQSSEWRRVSAHIGADQGPRRFQSCLCVADNIDRSPHK